MSSNNPLFPKTEEKVKEVISNTEADKPKSSKTKNRKPIQNEPNKGIALNKSRSLDKSRSSSINETKDTVKKLNKKRSISSASSYDKATKEQQPKEIKFRNEKLRSDNPSVSSMSIHGASTTTAFPEKYRIPCKIKKATFRNFDHRE